MAVEDEVLLEFQGEDSSLSKTAQSVLNDINQLDISIQNLISTFNSFSQASGSAESSLSTFTKVSGNISEVNSHIDEMTKNFSDSVGAINETATSMEQLSNASQPIQEVTSSMEDLKKSAEQKTQAIAQLEEEIDRTSKANDKWKNSMKPIVAGISTLYGTLKRFTLQAAEAYRTQTRFNAVFDRQSGELREAQQWVNDYADALMLDNMEVENAVSRFRIFTNTMGVNNEKSKEMSMNMTQLAYDLAAVSGNDVSQTVNQLTSALGGQTKALKQYGIAIDKNTLQQTLNEHGINRKISSLTAAELAETRYVQIMERSAGMQGYYARTLMSPANALNIIKTQFGMLAREIGNVFIPILMALVPIVRAVTSALRSLAQAIAGFFGISINFDDYSDGFSMMAGGIGDVGDAANGASKKMKNMLRDFDNLHVIDFNDMTGSGSGAGGGAGGGGDLFDAQKYADWQSALDGITEKFKVLGIILKAIAGFILGWNIGKLIGQFLSFIGILDKAKLGIFALGAALAGAGLVLIFDANRDIRINGLNKLNIIETIIGGILAGTGGALIALALGASPTVALTIGLVIGISLIAINFLTGLAKSFKEKYSEQIEQIKQEEGWYDTETGFGKKIEIVLDIIGKVGSLAVFDTFREFLHGTNEEVDNTNSKFDQMKDTFLSIFNVVDLVKAEFQGFKEQAIDPLKTSFEQFFTDVGASFQQFYDENKELVDAIVKILKVVVVAAITFLQLKIDYYITIIISAITAVTTFISNIIQSILKAVSQGIDALLNVISGFIKIFDGIIHFDLQKIIDGGKQMFQGFADGVKAIFNGIRNIVVSGLNGIISAFNVFIRAVNKISIPDWDIFGNLAGKNLNISELSQIPLYYKGGFPNKGDLFIANEREPELVGSMGNRSAVANNSQIIEGIAQGSYQAFVRAMRDTQSDTGGDTYVYVGDTQLTDVVTKRRKTQDRRFGR